MSFVSLLLYLTFSYIRPGDVDPSLAPYRIMLWLGSVGLAASVITLAGGRRASFRPPQIYLMLALILAITLSWLQNGWLGGALQAFQDFGVTVALFFLVILNVDSLGRMRVVAVLLVLLSLVLVIQGVAAYHFGYMDELFVLEQSGQLKRIRSLGLAGDPNDLAQALLVVLPLVGLAWRRGHRLRNLIVVGGASGLLLYGVYLTRSRGGVLSLLVLILAACRGRMGRAGAVVVTTAIAAALLVLNVTGGRDFSVQEESDQGRLDAWSAGLMMFREDPIFGVGFRAFTDFHDLTAHNSFILCFAELGFVGYFFWMALLVVTFLELSSLSSLPGSEPIDHALRRWARAVQLMLYTFLAAALFLSRTYTMTLYLIIALAASLANIARRAGKPVAIPSPILWAPKVGALSLASIFLFHLVVKIRNV